ncbi:hypothetical protein Mmc1_0342 [Magnetococcus marinus MC-1]|uniref:DUF2062 domain-containing protein n=1 Tax=Magnetococcus marinus (strain ATCC BAA-1437 / JCM 17883 / MC-1) TaxID=156889 RepID=A0L4H5_MAGMM|nr:DUF2062 domain-containing protein [Magnetococcus marinus]ABK42868.1 hypothetical protein Mmc1_0342 [Magnetococcus marinus MC-1]
MAAKGWRYPFFWMRTMFRFRLIRPMLQGGHPPEYAARASGIGLAIAMTPTVGVQIAAVMALWAWIKARKPDWDFNPMVAIAWTMVTNVVTLPPIYFMFVVTGRLMMGHWDGLSGYDEYTARIAQVLAPDAGWLESIWIQLHELFTTFGLPLLLGCLPWALICGWAGYFFTLRLVRKYQALREKRRIKNYVGLYKESHPYTSSNHAGPQK